jgi:hypothetical protein
MVIFIHFSVVRAVVARATKGTLLRDIAIGDIVSGIFSILGML